VHFNVYADDVDRAIAFHQTEFGWLIAKVEGMDYWLITTGERGRAIDGGLSQRESPSPGTVPQCGLTWTVDVEDDQAYTVTVDNDALTIVCPLDFSAELWRQASAAGVDHLTIRAKETSLEERFVTLWQGERR
jgi:hypothetical protein